MKSKIKQIIFLDTKLLPLYGFKSIHDYKTKISETDLKNNKDFLDKLNNIINDFKKVFPIKNFSLHKTKNKISSIKHAISFLKKCLNIAIVPFEFVIIKNIKWMRLIPQNNILNDYIYKKNNKKMSESRNLTNFSEFEPLQLIQSTGDFNIDDFNLDDKHGMKAFTPISMNYEGMIKHIKNKTTKIIYLPFLQYYDNGVLVLDDLSSYYQNLSSIKIEFSSYMLEDNLFFQKYFTGKSYDMYVNWSSAFKGNYQANVNLLPAHLIHLGSAIKVGSSLSFKFEDLKTLDIIKHLIVVKLEFEIIEFTANMQNRLSTGEWLQVPFITNDKEPPRINYIIYKSGMVGLKYAHDKSTLTINDINLTINGINLDKYGKSVDLITNNKTLKCFVFDQNIDQDKLDKEFGCNVALLVICNKENFNLVKAATCHINNKKNIEIIQLDEEFNIKYKIHRFCDALDNIIISLNPAININNMKMFIVSENQNISLQFEILDNNLIKASLNPSQCINLLSNRNSEIYFSIIIPKDNIDIEKLTILSNSIKIMIIPWYFNTDFRRQLADINNIKELVFDLSNLK